MVIHGIPPVHREVPYFIGWTDKELFDLEDMEMDASGFGQGRLIEGQTHSLEVKNERPKEQDAIRAVGDSWRNVVKSVSHFKSTKARAKTTYPENPDVIGLEKVFLDFIKNKGSFAQEAEMPGTQDSRWTECELFATIDMLVTEVIRLGARPEVSKQTEATHAQNLFDLGISSQTQKVGDEPEHNDGGSGDLDEAGLDNIIEKCLPRSLNQEHAIKQRSAKVGSAGTSTPFSSPEYVRATPVEGPLTEAEEMVFQWISAYIVVGEVPYIHVDDASILSADLKSIQINQLVDVSVLNKWCHFVNCEDRRKSPRSPSRFCFTVDASRALQGQPKNNRTVEDIAFEQVVFEVGRYDKIAKVNLEEKDLVFFSIVLRAHFFVVCIDKIRGVVLMIDNLSTNTMDDARYGDIPAQLRDLYARFIEPRFPKLSKKIREARPERMHVSWESETNGIDCAIFAMFHMESYNGGRRWKNRLEKDNQQQLDLLRARFAFKMVTWERNETWEFVHQHIVQLFKNRSPPKEFNFVRHL